MPRRLKTGCFALEWLNICASAYYFNYLYFHMRMEFGFGSRENLFLAAASGFLYAFGSWFAGKFAQRRGYFTALYTGFGILTLALAIGSGCDSLAAQIVVMLAWTFGICFTWPVLEALASEGETGSGLARMLGLYNVVWAAGSAVTYFAGGALLEALGRSSLFWLPAGLHALQLGLTWWLHRAAKKLDTGDLFATPAPPAAEPARSIHTKHFLRLAWLAIPFSYIAMNTLIPLMPSLAAKLGLTTTQAGFVASVWMFGRLAAFAGLWRWTGWHYRFRWLVTAYVGMILSFVAILLVPVLWVIVVAQLVFGLAVGLIYYSSLYYSMDVGDTKGEHGGFHEALIGAGLFGGPAVGAVVLYFLPGQPDAGIWAVGAMLVAGLGGLGWWRPRG